MTVTVESQPSVDADHATVERALIDVVRRAFARSFTRIAPDGQRFEKSAYHLMARLEESGDIRLSDLAALVELDVSTISRQVRQLEDSGLVSRRADPSDGRAARVDLTQHGRDMVADMRRDRHLLLAEAMSGWTPAERHQLGNLMQRLAADLGTVEEKPRPREVSR